MNEHREALRAMLSEKDRKLQKDQNGVVHLGKLKRRSGADKMNEHS